MKVLVVSAKLNIGGAQSVAANIAKYADDSMKFDYLVFGDEIGEYEEMIINKGNRVLHFPVANNQTFGFLKRLIRLMKEEKYDAVHAHTMFNCGVVMLAAKISGVPCRVSHSHTIAIEGKTSLVRRIYNICMRALICKCGNEYVACGVEAGYALYGKKWFDKYGTVIKNGIDFDSYAYSEHNRSVIREKYNLNGKFVIGHVGHYETVKNQVFLIDIFKRIKEEKSNAVLLLFGEGSKRAFLESEIEKRNLQNDVFLMGNINNVNEVLSAFDVFAFPSLFEGTPLALIEAQANGIPCVISDAIPPDACIKDDIVRLSLSDVDTWIKMINDSKRNINSIQISNLVTNYEDVNESMRKIYNMYSKYVEG